MNRIVTFAAIGVTLALAACASKQAASPPPSAATPTTTTSASPSQVAPQKVKSRDGKFEGDVYGRPASGAKFAGLQIGMHMNEVQDVMGRAPDRSHSYESGKRWIPFYFGNDARRIQALYKGEGCVTFTGGNVWGGAAGDLIVIQHDPAGACYQP